MMMEAHYIYKKEIADLKQTIGWDEAKASSGDI